ncbi:root hair defective 3 GTP-binding protein [Lentinula edodes]|uniref:root hair defective 3 GTP-binding protein n=1 Tax=Lentinula edodes TaxID=5353 RepID=UPI001E8DFFE4|nr:root hair defective 3 GTP-binding protein [Lentinula edodes]KAH7873308.1 root hair defective 3 GTP-binding protein [Lentinula edodes]
MASASIGAFGNALASPMTNGHSPLSERIQIINDQKQFTSELTSQIERWDLRDAGFNYNIVAVFGSQSTGKSTLLNRLFGTTFDVMDETKRQQTTKGIWMCRGKDMNIMVMDVEGTDGRERGEDQDFERKSALFSLASSEVLIINLWEHQVGLYQGANMGLLKTVFEVNLGLFGGKKAQDGTNGRTLLLFVIRDHIGTTPLANLQATLTADLQRIWDSLSKPDELKDRQLTDYFDLDFTALPHKILATDQFELETRNLRGRFVDKTKSDYLFKSIYHKRIPADGVAFYMENIWEQVQSNKDLDLPTQQELLAQFRCDEISAVALTEFNEQAKPQKRPIEAGKVVEGLGAMMRSWRTVALERYDRDASRYHQGVYKRKRADLIVSLDATLSPLFLGQLKNLHKACLGAFKKDILEGMKGEEYNFADVVSKAKAKCDNRFTTGARESVVDDSEEGKTEWNWEEELELLREEVQSVADQCRKDETKKMVNTIERNFKKQISEPIELALNKGSPNMWDEVLKAFRQTLDKAESTYLIKATSFNCTEEENTYSLAALRRRAWQALRSKIDEQTADSVFVGRLRAHFEERFRYDEQGVPRVWKPEDDIDGVYRKAKEQTLELIPLYSKIVPLDSSVAYVLPPDAISSSDSGSSLEEAFDFESSLVVFSETKALDLAAKFRKDADLAYVEAKRSTVSSVAQIPFWMYGVLLVLGWNEFMMVLFNPIYFMFLLMAAAAAYLIIQLGLAGPLLSITQTMGLEIKRQATQKLREHFSEPMLAQAQAHNARSQSSSMIEEEDYELRKRQEGSPM